MPYNVYKSSRLIIPDEISLSPPPIKIIDQTCSHCLNIWEAGALADVSRRARPILYIHLYADFVTIRRLIY